MRTRWTSTSTTTTTSCSWPAAVQRSCVSRRSPARSSRVGRIRAVTVATGCDPMAVHEAYEALGVPVDVTVHSARAARPEPGGRRGGAAHPARRPARRPRPFGDHGARRGDDRGRRRAGRVLAADPRGAPAGRGRDGRPALPVPAGGEPAGHRPAGVAVPHHGRCGAGQPDRARTRSRSATRWPRTPSRPTSASPVSSGGSGHAGRGWSWWAWTVPTPSASSRASRICWTASRTSNSSPSAGSPHTAPRTRWPCTTGPSSSATCPRRSCSG